MSNPQRQPPTLASRRSYFLEGPMEEYTPANSVLEGQSSRDGDRGRGRLCFWMDDRGRPVLRVLNAVVHLGLCAVLLAIMGEFMARYGGHSRRPQAIALIVLVAAECCLDIYSAIWARKKWQGWALVLRLLFSLGYIAQFFVYVGFREVFPRNYSYWGMNAAYSEPVVYLLLWVLGIWNLLHTTLHRHTLGRDLRRYKTAFLGLRRRGTETSGGDSGSGNSAWATPRTHGRERQSASQARVEHDLESGMPIALAQVDADVDDKRRHVVTMTRSGPGSTSGESSSQAGTLSRTESKTISTGTSRRPSISASEETLRGDGDANDLVGVKSKS